MRGCQKNTIVIYSKKKLATNDIKYISLQAFL